MGEREPKKRDFLLNIFQKAPENAAFFKFCLRCRKFGQNRVDLVSENQFGWPKT